MGTAQESRLFTTFDPIFILFYFNWRHLNAFMDVDSLVCKLEWILSPVWA